MARQCHWCSRGKQCKMHVGGSSTITASKDGTQRNLTAQRRRNKVKVELN